MLELLQFTSDTAETEEVIETIVTGYGDLKIPVMTTVVMIFTAVLLIAVAILTFAFFMKRGRNWGYSILVGMLVYMLSGYILYIGSSFALAKIPGGEKYFSENPNMLGLVLTVLTCVYEVICLFLGMKFIFSTAEKRNTPVDIVSVIMLSLGFYIFCNLMSNNLVYTYEYATIAASINKMGFDEAVTTLVQGGTPVEDAIKAVLELVNQNPWVFFVDGITYILKAAIVASAATALYGVMKEKLSAKWYLYTIIVTVLSYIPSGLAGTVSLPFYASAIMLFVIAGASIYGMYFIITKFLPEDITVLKTKVEREKKHYGEQPKKMPKINMPK